MVHSELGRAAHSINVLILDDQHEVLFENIRLLEDAMRRGEGASEVPRILGSLIETASFHFPTEEHLMRRYKYPLRDSHAIEHRVLSRHLRKMGSLVRAGENIVAIELIDLLYRWQESHVMTWDARLGEYLNERRVT